MVEEKLTRRDLKEPDEFESFANQAVEWLRKNWKIVSAAIGILILLVILIQLFLWHTENKEKEASQKLVAALEEVMVKKDLISSLSPGTADPDKIQKTLSSLEQIEKQYASVRTSKMARYFKGELQRRLGKYEEAISSFNEFVSYYGEDSEFSVYALEGIGACLEAQGRFKEALVQYEKLEKVRKNPEPDRAIYHQARVHLQLGNRQKAKELFKMVLEKYPDTSLRQEIQNRLAFLELQQESNTSNEENSSEKTSSGSGGQG